MRAATRLLPGPVYAAQSRCWRRRRGQRAGCNRRPRRPAPHRGSTPASRRPAKGPPPAHYRLQQLDASIRTSQIKGPFVVDYGAFPPEFNSARIYSGPGSGS
ncbi:hypothetical protein GBQ62_21475, partial [Mycobacterium avium subsp. hominissuis]|nr:hypothetical protein [Mycobacterium avium subsp. hominissuis]